MPPGFGHPFGPFHLLNMIRKLIRKLAPKSEMRRRWPRGRRDMQRTRWLLIGLLALASAGCVRRDWVSDLLVLTDVTGTWEGSARSMGGVRIPITLVLQQSGPKVTGELSWTRGQGRVEGVVTGEVLTFSEGIKAELAIDGDEMWGRVDDRLFANISICQPCFLRFRRESSPVPPPSESPARQER